MCIRDRYIYIYIYIYIWLQNGDDIYEGIKLKCLWILYSSQVIKLFCEKQKMNYNVLYLNFTELAELVTSITWESAENQSDAITWGSYSVRTKACTGSRMWGLDRDVENKSSKLSCICGTILRKLKNKFRSETRIKLFMVMVVLYSAELWTLWKAVSYTHLDVYKRQVRRKHETNKRVC